MDKERQRSGKGLIFLIGGILIIAALVILRKGVPAFDMRRMREARRMRAESVLTRRSGRDVLVQVRFRTM